MCWHARALEQSVQARCSKMRFPNHRTMTQPGCTGMMSSSRDLSCGSDRSRRAHGARSRRPEGELLSATQMNVYCRHVGSLIFVAADGVGVTFAAREMVCTRRALFHIYHRIRGEPSSIWAMSFNYSLGLTHCRSFLRSCSCSATSTGVECERHEGSLYQYQWASHVVLGLAPHMQGPSSSTYVCWALITPERDLAVPVQNVNDGICQRNVLKHLT